MINPAVVSLRRHAAEQMQMVASHRERRAMLVEIVSQTIDWACTEANRLKQEERAAISAAWDAAEHARSILREERRR